MPATRLSRSDPPTNCAHCGAAGPLTIQVYPDDGRPTFALCTSCSRDPARLRALVRALGRKTATDERTSAN